MEVTDLRHELKNTPKKAAKRSAENPAPVAEAGPTAEPERSTSSLEEAAEVDLNRKATPSKLAKRGSRAKSVSHSSEKEAESEIVTPIAETPNKADEFKFIPSNATEFVAEVSSGVFEPTTQGAIATDTVTEISTVEEPMETGDEEPEPVDDGATGKFVVKDLPDSVMLKILSYIPWQEQIKLESVSTRWNNVLDDKSLRRIGKVDLNLLKKGDISNLPRAVHSLLVNKHKVINSITYVTEACPDKADIDTFNVVVSTFSSIRPEQLISLKIGDDFRFQPCQADEFRQFLNCFVNLEVLDLAVGSRLYNPPPNIDLSHLMNLKELKGVNVQFVNCRARLVKMDLCGVKLSGTDESNDFVQMMLSVAESIDVLHLSSVELLDYRPPSERQMSITFPKLSDFNLSFCTLVDITVNLVESCNLKRFHFEHSICDVTNFNLYIHCLEYIRIHPYSTDTDLAYQFLASAKANPQRLCLLEYLGIINSSLPIVDLLDCFSPCYTYYLHEFTFDQELTECSALVALIEHCPLLNRLSFNTSQKVLIDLIIGTIPLDIHVNGLCIQRADYQTYFDVDHDFLIILYNALCLIDPMTMKCQNKVVVKVSDGASDLTRKIKNEFNICFSMEEVSL